MDPSYWEKKKYSRRQLSIPSHSHIEAGVACLGKIVACKNVRCSPDLDHVEDHQRQIRFDSHHVNLIISERDQFNARIRRNVWI